MAETPAPPPPLSTLPPTGSNATQEVALSSGTHFGRFAVQRFHAKGGLGEVHVAIDAELGRDVALKRIQDRFAHDAAAQRRFLNEAEITARLEHPGIVPIYGLVQDEQGQPCYAMRFIAGESLAEAIKQWHGEPPGSPRRDGGDKPRRSQDYTALPFRQLLQRFISVCQTMAYAHSKGVIHRDLKPANVMLGPYGETLVVDWGLAKTAVNGQQSEIREEEGPLPTTVDFTRGSTDDHVYTQAGQVLGTAGYMSPEQAAGRWDVVGPTSDIYSLGATLYELLTGQRPLSGNDIFAVLQKTQAGDISTPRQVQPAVPKSLEAICLKAMALKPEARYTSAGELATDLEHWLADELVSAYAEPWTLRARRWMRRHRPLVTGLMVTLVAAVVMLLVVIVLLEQARQRVSDEQKRTAEQRQEAELAFAKAKEAVDRFYKEVAEDPQLRGTPGLHGLRKRLLEAAVPFFQWFTDRNPSRPRWRADQGWAYCRLADIQQELGERVQELTNRQRHRDVCLQLVAEYPHETAYHGDLSGASHNLAAMFQRQGAWAEAQRLYEEAVAHAELVVRAEPTNARHRQFMANHHNNLGALLMEMGKYPAAEATFRHVLKIQEKLVTDFPAVLGYRWALTRSYHNLGAVLAEAEQEPAAEAVFRRALALREKLIADLPPLPEYRQDLASTYHELGKLLANVGQRPAAAAASRRALELREKLAADFPAVPAYRLDLAKSHHQLGALLASAGQLSATETAFRRALELHEQLAADFPTMPEYRWGLANSHLSLESLWADQGKYPAAEAACRRAIELMEKLTADFPAVPSNRHQLALSHHSLGYVLIRTNQRPTAYAANRRALELQERLVADFPTKPSYRRELAAYYNNTGALLKDLGQYSAEEAAYRRALEIYTKLVADFPTVPVYRQDLAANHINFGILLRNQGQAEASLKCFTKAIILLEYLGREESQWATTQFYLRQAHWGRANVLNLLGRHSEALKDWDRTLEFNTEATRIPPLRRLRAISLAHAGQHAEAILEVNAQDKTTTLSATALYELARICALAAASLKDDDTLRDQYAARAVALLHQAIAKGYKNVAQLKKDEDLKALRQREDFQKLLQELEKAKP